MAEPEDKLERSYAYAGTFLTTGRAHKYEHKFDRRIEIIRHRLEVDILNRHAHGRLFDCSVGSGRFIPELTQVTSYEGMDYSPAFVELVRSKHPEIKIERGDLLEGIKADSEAYDTVMCLRTLPQMARLEHILAEMARLAQPGGLVIFDYGPPESGSAPGETAAPGRYDIADLLTRLPVSQEASYRLDSWLAMGVKANPRLFRLFNHRLNLVPNTIYSLAERALTRLSCARLLYVLRKRA